jgi:hypothetical protein
MKRLLITLSLLMAHATGWALPTLDAVQAEIQRGHYTQAEDMMREVVTAKPGSARAHYVYAELLAHDRHFGQAAEEAALARRLAPDLRFTQPEKFNAFTRLLEREQGTARPVDRTSVSLPHASAPAPALAPVQARQSSGVPGWALGVGGLTVLALLAWRALGSRRPGQAAASAAAPGSTSHAPPAYAPVPPATGGSGLLGTGLAAAGGVAAGVLMEKWLEGRHGQAPEVRQEPTGFATGLFDRDPSTDTAARELEQRPIDMGSGSGWDDGDSGSTTDNNDGW